MWFKPTIYSSINWLTGIQSGFYSVFIMTGWIIYPLFTSHMITKCKRKWLILINIIYFCFWNLVSKNRRNILHLCVSFANLKLSNSVLYKISHIKLLKYFIVKKQTFFLLLTTYHISHIYIISWHIQYHISHNIYAYA